VPTIKIVFSDLELLVGKHLPRNTEELTELLSYIKGEVEALQDQELSIEIKDGNRPDLLSVEGISRALRGVLGIEEGLKQYSAESSLGVEIHVDKRLKEIRPYIASAIIKGIRLSNVAIQQLIHLQDKLDQTYGRQRKRTSIGLYDFTLIKPPLNYTVADPSGASFIPLGYEKKMNLKKILEVHPKGIEYGNLIKMFTSWPILLDSNEKIISFPPIINSANVGKITEETKEVFIEVTGTDYGAVLNTLTLVTLALADRGGEIYNVCNCYPYSRIQREITPKFLTSEIKLDLGLIDKILGIKLSQDEVVTLLKRSRFNSKPADTESLIVTIPCYRFDIMHPVDIIEEIAIMYGYSSFERRWPKMITFGEISTSELLSDAVRETMIGLGFQEVLSFSLSTPQNLFTKMNLKTKRIVKITNPINERFTCLRSWLMPSLMEFLSNNTHISYPQMIFEVGECAVLKKTSNTGIVDLKKLACVAIHSRASFSEIKAVVNSFLVNFGLTPELQETDHETFIAGRVGSILIDKKKIGILGEINPKVLESWGLENPAIGCEIDLSELFDIN